MNLKLVSDTWTGVHEKARKDVIYAVGQVTMAPDWDPRPVCGGGIHYAEKPNDYMPDPTPGSHLIEVEPVGKTVRIGGNKTKAQGIRVVREITHILTPEEEPNTDVRWCVAWRIPDDKLDRLLTPACEPSAGVRREVASRIPAEKLDHILTLEEEPDAEVRWQVTLRIPAERLDHRLTPEEEPDVSIRLQVSLRIKNKA